MSTLTLAVFGQSLGFSQKPTENTEKKFNIMFLT